MKETLTLEVFRGLKAGDIISSRTNEYTGGPAGYDWEVLEGYKDGRVKIRIKYSIGTEIKTGEPYYVYEELTENPNLYKKYPVTYEEFRQEVLDALQNKPKWSRKGQFVFNWIEEHYGQVARYVQFIDRVDCFYDDGMIEPFMVKCYCFLKEHDLL